MGFLQIDSEFFKNYRSLEKYYKCYINVFRYNQSTVFEKNIDKYEKRVFKIRM